MVKVAAAAAAAAAATSKRSPTAGLQLGLSARVPAGACTYVPVRARTDRRASERVRIAPRFEDGASIPVEPVLRAALRRAARPAVDVGARVCACVRGDSRDRRCVRARRRRGARGRDNAAASFWNTVAERPCRRRRRVRARRHRSSAVDVTPLFQRERTTNRLARIHRARTRQWKEVFPLSGLEICY